MLNGRGAYLLPGLVDIHCDAVEKAIMPRPNIFFPIELACRDLERQLAATGITTMFHSISFSDGEGVRSNELAATIARYIAGMELEPHLIRNRVHLRYEVTNIGGLALMEELISEGVGALFSFMDHTPGQGQYREVEQYVSYARKTYWLDGNQCAQLVEQKIRDRHNVKQEQLRRLAESAILQGIPLASHDDDSPERVKHMFSLGVTVAEFPVNLDTAKFARAEGLHVCVGAPNLLRGDSHNGNLRAAEAIDSWAANILCSDYYPPALLRAVFRLSESGFDLSAAVCLATLHPAQAVGLADELGSIEVGKKADLILVSLLRGRPVVMATLVDGRLAAQFAYGVKPMGGKPLEI
jgi:alpha-D-ribose 1-methylphosphonate 5-triphosphate diphosphatase